MQLTSTKNPVLQSIRRAAAGGRATEDGLIVAEGPHLLEEALRGRWTIEQIFATPEARARYADLLRRADAEIVEVPARAFAAIASTETTREVLALLRPRAWNWGDLLGSNPLLVVLDAIQDPGNAGTILRSAEAFGATGAVLLQGCARIANGKFLRGAAGSLFRVPLVEGWEPGGFLAQARQEALRVYALDQRARATLEKADFRLPSTLLVGSEGRGLSPELAHHVHPISIPTAKVESLNAAVACSIALFEARRQRSQHEPV
jgi:RNA methyltransferase, TrmH family